LILIDFNRTEHNFITLGVSAKCAYDNMSGANEPIKWMAVFALTSRGGFERVMGGVGGDESKALDRLGARRA
jgi:hypothetical protein